MKTTAFAPDSQTAVLAAFLRAPANALSLFRRMGMDEDAFVGADKLAFVPLLECAASGTAIDHLAYAEKLRQLGTLEKIGGAARVAEIFAGYAGPSVTEQHFGILRNCWLKRRLLVFAEAAPSRIEAGNPLETLGEFQSELIGMVSSAHRGRLSIKEVVREILEEIMHGKQDSALLQTGIAALDSEVRLYRSDFVVVPGPTSSGKSALCANIAVSMAKAGRRVMVFALEMSVKQMIKRALASESGYNAEHVRRLALQASEQAFGNEKAQAATKAFADAAKKVLALDLQVFDDVRHLDEILATARAAAAEKPLDLLVVDYPALMRLPGTFERRQLALAHAVNAFKHFAVEQNCLVIVPSQVNAQGGTREAADFEHAANCILQVTVDEDETRHVIVGKQRDGARGQELALRWHGATTSFQSA